MQALPIVAMAFTAGGQIMEGIGANNEARAAARIDQENGRLSLLSGEQDVAQILRDERMMAGEAIAGMAGNGAAIGWGSAADIIAESAMNRDRDIAARRLQAAQEDANYQQAAADKRAAGRNALITSAFNAVGSVLNGVSSMQAGRRTSAAQSSVRAAQQD